MRIDTLLAQFPGLFFQEHIRLIKTNRIKPLQVPGLKPGNLHDDRAEKRCPFLILNFNIYIVNIIKSQIKLTTSLIFPEIFVIFKQAFMEVCSAKNIFSFDERAFFPIRRM